MHFNFDTALEYILEDEHVLLRPLQISDYEYLLPYALNEPATWQYSHLSAAGDEGMKNYIAAAMAARAEGREYAFIVFDKLTNTYAGCTRFYDIQPHNLVVQLGYTWYGERFRGTKLNKHCKFLMMGLVFEQMGVERLEFRADNNNQRSIAAMKSIGCKVDGVLRSNVTKPDGNRRDSIVLSVLKDEWFNGVKANLQAKL